MRVKELKAMLDKIPDDAEVLIRAKINKSSRGEKSQTTVVGSASPIVDSENQQIILNPIKPLRLINLQPDKNEEVFCTNCAYFKKLDACKNKGRSCSTCNISCQCKLCLPYNPDSPATYAERSMYVEEN